MATSLLFRPAVKWTEQNFLDKQLNKLLKEVKFKGVSK